MDWQGRSVSITGASGFIGSHLTERLLALGAEVHALIHNGRTGHLGHIQHPRLQLLSGDLRDRTFVFDALSGSDTVFHLGAVTSVQYSYLHPEETAQTNVLGTLHVCEAARESKARRLVHTSSAGVYGDAEKGQPITERHRVIGKNPYTAAKIGADALVESFYCSYDLPACTIRLFNTYGPRVGDFLIIATIIRQLLAGPELRLGELSPVRTFVYINDIIDAFLAMAASEKVIGEVVHFAGQEPISMQGLVDKIAALMGVRYQLIPDPSRLRPAKSEIHSVLADTRKAATLLSWSAQTTLETGLPPTIHWFKNNSQ